MLCSIKKMLLALPVLLLLTFSLGAQNLKSFDLQTSLHQTDVISEDAVWSDGEIVVFLDQNGFLFKIDIAGNKIQINQTPISSNTTGLAYDPDADKVFFVNHINQLCNYFFQNGGYTFAVISIPNAVHPTNHNLRYINDRIYYFDQAKKLDYYGYQNGGWIHGNLIASVTQIPVAATGSNIAGNPDLEKVFYVTQNGSIFNVYPAGLNSAGGFVSNGSNLAHTGSKLISGPYGDKVYFVSDNSNLANYYWDSGTNSYLFGYLNLTLENLGNGLFFGVNQMEEVFFVNSFNNIL